MAPSLFSSRPLEPASNTRGSPLRPPPESHSRLKTLSAFLSHPFSSAGVTVSPSNASPSPSHPHPHQHSHLHPHPYPPTQTHTQTQTLPHPQRKPSAPMPYYPPKAEMLIPGSQGSPFRVFIADGAGSGLPSTTSTSLSNHQLGAAGISGLPLPGSHRGLAALLSGSGSGQGKEVGDHTLWRELPTLASAIRLDAIGPHLPQPPTSTTFGPAQPLPRPIYFSFDKDTAVIPRSASNSSDVSRLSGPFRSGKKSAVKRTASRESVKGKTASIPRRMSRRFSFDSVRLFSASKSSAQRGVSEEPLLVNEDASPAPAPFVLKPNPLAMPNMGTRTWRSKFVVGNSRDKSGSLAGAKADIAARHAARQSANDTDKGSKAVLDSGSLCGSVSAGASVMDGDMNERVNVEKMFGRRTLPRLPIPSLVDPALTSGGKKTAPPTESPAADAGIRHSPLPVKSDDLPTQIANPQCLPLQIPPSPARQRLELVHRIQQTPCDQPSKLMIPSTSHMSLALSPATDDISFVDPGRSPLQTPSPSPSPSPCPSLSQSPAKQTAAVENESVYRQTSLSELKDAFSRMRDLSGVDISSVASSIPGSRRTSAGRPPEEAGHVDPPASLFLQTESTCAESQRPALDLGPIDRRLKDVVLHMVAAPSSSTVQPLANTTDGFSQSSSASSGMVTCPSSVPTGEDEMSHAPSGRSFHTATDGFAGDETASVAGPLAHSRSRSTHDIASLASRKNLIEELEQTQGPGWYSAERAHHARRLSLGRLPDARGSRVHGRSDEAEERLVVLERLAKTSTLPARSQLDRPPSPPSPVSPTAVHSQSRRKAEGLERRARPMSSMDCFRPRLAQQHQQRQHQHQHHHQPPHQHHTRHHQSLGEWKTSVAPASCRSGGRYRGRETRHSSISNPWDEPASPRRRAVLGLGRASMSGSQGDDETPTRHGPFGRAKISPDIARRASFLNRHERAHTQDPASGRASVLPCASPTALRRVSAARGSPSTIRRPSAAAASPSTVRRPSASAASPSTIRRPSASTASPSTMRRPSASAASPRTRTKGCASPRTSRRKAVPRMSMNTDEFSPNVKTSISTSVKDGDAGARTKHQLEVDALLEALSAATDDAHGLREEVVVLRGLLDDTAAEKRRLEERVRELEVLAGR